MVDSVTLSAGDKSVTITKDKLAQAAESVTGRARGRTRVAAGLGPTLVADEHGEVSRVCVLGLDPAGNARIPYESSFAEGEDYLYDEKLEKLVFAVMAKHGMEGRFTLLVRWKKNGGRSKGNEVHGKCEKLSGLTKHFAQADYVIWLAADHLTSWQYTNWQLQALIYHELLHIEVEEDDDGNEKLTTRGHDCEMFVGELHHYGTWRDDLVRVKHGIEQIPLALS